MKAVRLRSREFDVIRVLSTPPLRNDPMNHTIRERTHPFPSPTSDSNRNPAVLDLIPVPEDDMGFIVQEEWSPQLVSSTPCSLRGLLRALRQCIEV